MRTKVLNIMILTAEDAKDYHGGRKELFSFFVFFAISLCPLRLKHLPLIRLFLNLTQQTLG